MPNDQLPRRNADRTRRKLLDAAIRLFSTRGYHGVAVDQIVDAAKVNKRMVYHYFGNKDGIYQAAFKEVYTRIDSIEFHAVERGRSPREKLTRLLESYFEFLVDNPEFTQLFQWENADKGRNIGKRDHFLSKNTFMVRFRQIVAEGVAAREFRENLDVTHLLIHFIGLCFIYHTHRYTLSHCLELDLGDSGVRAAGLSQVIDLVFEGICVHARPALADPRADAPVLT